MGTFTVTGEADIDHWIAEVKRVALQGALHVTQLTFPNGTSQYVVVTQPIGPELETTNSLFGQTVHTAAFESQRDKSGSDLVWWVLSAFRQFEYPAQLAQNRLAKVLDLSAYQRVGDAPSIAAGKALQRIIQSEIEALEQRGTAHDVKLVEVFRERFLYGGKSQLALAEQWERNPVTIRRYEKKLAQRIAAKLQQLRKPV